MSEREPRKRGSGGQGEVGTVRPPELWSIALLGQGLAALLLIDAVVTMLR